MASVLAPDGMPGVEHREIFGNGAFPDRQDSVDPCAFVYPGSLGDAALAAPYMTYALFHEPTPPSHTPEASRETTAPDEIEESYLFYEESGFPEDIEDEYAVEERKNTEVPTVELIKGDEEGHMEPEQDFWSLPGQFHNPAEVRH